MMRAVGEHSTKSSSGSRIRRTAWRRQSARGFTIVELMVVVAIIAVLLGMLLPALSSARQTGNLTTELSAARQLMVAYENYTVNNNSMLMPGYLIGMHAYDQSGQPIESAIAAGRYMWRLLPYLDYAVRGLYTNENRDLLERLENEDPATYRYAISLFPSLGLNTSWLGGDEQDQAFDPLFLSIFGRYYLTRITEAKRPGDLIVFASARGKDTSGMLGPGLFEGYYKVMSRNFTGTRWPEEYDPSDPPVAYGYLSLRYRGGAVTAFLDGRAELMPEKKLRDMRHWADQADLPDWKLQPPF